MIIVGTSDKIVFSNIFAMSFICLGCFNPTMITFRPFNKKSCICSVVISTEFASVVSTTSLSGGILNAC